MSEMVPPPRVLVNEDAIRQAVDDYLLMERKARAWDAAVEYFNKWPSLQEYAGRLDEIMESVHSAHDPSTC